MKPNTNIPNVLDGWKTVYIAGTTYWKMYDCGEFILRCTRLGRDKILAESSLPLKLIDSEF